MPSTIRDLTELTAVAADDYFLVSDTSDVTNRDKRISQANLLGGNLLRTFSGGVNLVAPTAILNVGDPAQTDTINASGTGTTIGLTRYNAAATSGVLALRKSRNATIGSHTAVIANDELGKVFFYGSNGSSFDLGAAIIARVDGTPGAGDMPTRIEFQTSADGTATPTTVMTLGANNLATFAGGINLGQTTLNYYEEGSWTPQIADAATGGNLGSGTLTGRYQRIGGMVTVWGNLVDLNKASMVTTQAVFIRNLPFAARAITGFFYHGVVSVSRWTFTSYVLARLAQGQTYLNFVQHVSNISTTESNLLVSDIGTNNFTDAYFTISYLV